MDLGARIDAWRRIRGVTQAALAKAAEVTPAAVNAWIKGVKKGGVRVKQPPTQKNLEAVVAFLGLTMAEFYGALPEPRRSRKAA